MKNKKEPDWALFCHYFVSVSMTTSPSYAPHFLHTRWARIIAPHFEHLARVGRESFQWLDLLLSLRAFDCFLFGTAIVFTPPWSVSTVCHIYFLIFAIVFGFGRFLGTELLKKRTKRRKARVGLLAIAGAGRHVKVGTAPLAKAAAILTAEDL